MEENMVESEAFIADQQLLDARKSDPETSAFAVRASGPLTEPSRKLKKPLLLLSIIGIVMIKTNLIPEKITAFGIEFTKTDQNTILLIISASVFYFLVGFMICVISDYLVWSHFLSASKWQIYPHTQNIFKRNSLFSKLLIFVRLTYEVLIPIIIGVYAIKLLWKYSVQAIPTFF
jgi:hypothetical protein